ncbi:MAG TPA: metallophosphoesterase [Candidatus Coprenecus stercoravium]|uniref:Metallophosphoesterase n=1 Tax=Candidatus Coprenecus stercoravium TaxID=2840735 RepID=A0A9D2GQU5_9BACT|nr:metallophosphoesterase [Candidatus Coprenecus stercoravium]
MHLFYLIVSLLVILPDLYIRLVCLRGISLGWWNLLYWAPLAFFLFLVVMYFAGGSQPFVFKSMVASILCFTVPKLLFTIMSILCLGAVYAAGCFGAQETVRSALTGVFNAIGIGLAGSFLILALYGLTAGVKRLDVREEVFESDSLPASFDGYRIVHLSDLHASSYSAPGMVERLVTTVNDLDADMIAFTGDLVNSSPSELDERMMSALSSLRAHDGVFAVVGNHDYCEYHEYDTPDGAARAFAEVVRCERAMGWRVLMDSSAVITRPSVSAPDKKQDSIYVIGVEHCGKPPFGSRGDLQKALSGVPPVFFYSDADSVRSSSPFKILLSHDSSHWRMEVLPHTDIQLTLSGHTHAMQFRIGRFSPSRWMYREWYGVYREGARMLNVSAGLGGSFPFRIGAWPEIVVITLHTLSGQGN